MPQLNDRKFTLIEPTTACGTLLLFFHGSLQSGNVMRRFTNGTFDDLARRTGTVLIYPDGVDRHFNDARRVLPVAARERGIDDVAFTRELVDYARAEYGITRVVACGYSNGGQMVLRLLFDAPGLLDAACIFASTLGAGDNHAPTNPDSAYRPTPVMLMHGTADPLVPYDGGGTPARGEMTSAPWTAARLAELNHAGPQPVETRPYEGVAKRVWGGANPVELWTLHGVGHVIPSGIELDARLGPTTHAFLAADVVGQFFKL